MSIKFREIKVRGRYFSRIFKFANFLKSRKSRIQEPAKMKENKVPIPEKKKPEIECKRGLIALVHGLLCETIERSFLIFR